MSEPGTFSSATCSQREPGAGLRVGAAAHDEPRARRPHVVGRRRVHQQPGAAPVDEVGVRVVRAVGHEIPRRRARGAGRRARGSAAAPTTRRAPPRPRRAVEQHVEQSSHGGQHTCYTSRRGSEASPRRVSEASPRRAARRRRRPALRLVRQRPALPRLPRRGVGPARRRRPASLREALPRGLPGRASPGSRSCASARTSGAPSAASRSSAVARMGARDVERLLARPGHRPPPRQDRGRARERARGGERSPTSSARSPRYVWRFEPRGGGAPAARHARGPRHASPRAPSRAPSRAISACAASASSDRPPSTPSCRRWAS